MSVKLIEKMGENEWVFLPSKAVKQISVNELIEAEELMDAGKIMQAAKILHRIITAVPDCIEAYNDMYLCRCMLGHEDVAFEYIKQDVARIQEMLPAQLFGKKQVLNWGFLENRAFMRLYHNLGVEFVGRGQIAEAQTIFEHLLMWNPHDNQGAREHLVDCYLARNDFKKIVALAKRYPGDAMAPGVTYSLPLALLMLGKLDEAKEALKVAVKSLPNIAKELLKQKHKKPPQREGGFIILGGEDQAYYYWKEYGDFWKNPEFLPLLQELAQLQSQIKEK